MMEEWQMSHFCSNSFSVGREREGPVRCRQRFRSISFSEIDLLKELTEETFDPSEQKFFKHTQRWVSFWRFVREQVKSEFSSILMRLWKPKGENQSSFFTSGQVPSILNISSISTSGLGRRQRHSQNISLRESESGEPWKFDWIQFSSSPPLDFELIFFLFYSILRENLRNVNMARMWKISAWWNLFVSSSSLFELRSFWFFLFVD